MKKISLMLALLIFSSLLANSALAVIYKYVDDNGRLVFVDDESKIPPKYRQKTAPIRERADDLTAEELQAYQTRQAEESAERTIRQQAQQEAALEEQERDYQTPIMVRSNRVLVPVEVAVRNRVAHVMLLLDTGATRTVFHRSSLGDLPLAEGEKMQAQIAGGRTVPTEKVKVRYLEVGPFREKDTEVMLIDAVRSGLPFDGMLGNDFLRSHPYEIDYQKEIIYWKMQH
jgi:predicted aspartyl protease